MHHNWAVGRLLEVGQLKYMLTIAHLLQTQMKYISFKVNTLPQTTNSSKLDFRVNQALSQWKYLYLAFSSLRKEGHLLIYVAQIQYKIL